MKLFGGNCWIVLVGMVTWLEFVLDQRRLGKALNNSECLALADDQKVVFDSLDDPLDEESPFEN